MLSVTRILICKVTTDQIPERNNKLDGEIEEHNNSESKGMFTVAAKGWSLTVPELYVSDTGTYEVTIINKIGISSTWMERWKKITGRFMHSVYDKKSNEGECRCTLKMEFIICCEYYFCVCVCVFVYMKLCTL